MTPEEIAAVRPRLLGFAAEMLGGLARKDQRAAGELYVRGLLTDGRRKSMVAMAERLGVDQATLHWEDNTYAQTATSDSGELLYTIVHTAVRHDSDPVR
jgi:hypothetical protein